MELRDWCHFTMWISDA